MKYLVLLTSLLLVGCEGGDGTVPLPPTECTATLTWEAPIETIDGTPITTQDFIKYTIYMSEEPEVEDHFIELVTDVTDVNMITMEIRDIPDGQHWFYLTVTDIENRVSPHSNVLGKLCSPNG